MLSKADRGLFIINKALCVWPGRSRKPATRGVGQRRSIKVLTASPLLVARARDVFTQVVVTPVPKISTVATPPTEWRYYVTCLRSHS